MYRVRAVNPDDEDVCDTIVDLHKLCFGKSAPIEDPAKRGAWWVLYRGTEPVGFCGLLNTAYYRKTGYLARVAILDKHRGRGLNRRLLKACERYARSVGWKAIVSDTTDNNPSANGFIREGYKLFTPTYPWSFKGALYWRKTL